MHTGGKSGQYMTYHIWWLSPKETLAAENIALFNYLHKELADFKPPLCDFFFLFLPTEMLWFNKAILAKCFSYSDFPSGILFYTFSMHFSCRSMVFIVLQHYARLYSGK